MSRDRASAKPKGRDEGEKTKETSKDDSGKKSIMSNILPAGVGAVAALGISGIGFWLLYKQIADLRTKIDPVVRDNTDLAQYVSLMESNYVAAINEHATIIKDLHTTVQELKVTIQTLNQNNNELSQRLETAEAKLESFHRHINNLTSSHNNLAAGVKVKVQGLEEGVRPCNVPRAETHRTPQQKQQKYSHKQPQSQDVDSDVPLSEGEEENPIRKQKSKVEVAKRPTKIAQETDGAERESPPPARRNLRREIDDPEFAPQSKHRQNSKPNQKQIQANEEEEEAPRRGRKQVSRKQEVEIDSDVPLENEQKPTRKPKKPQKQEQEDEDENLQEDDGRRNRKLGDLVRQMKEDVPEDD